MRVWLRQYGLKAAWPVLGLAGVGLFAVVLNWTVTYWVTTEVRLDEIRATTARAVQHSEHQLLYDEIRELRTIVEQRCKAE